MVSILKKKKNILLIEDDPKLVKSISEILGREYKLETADTAEKAVKIIQKAVPSLILLDFDLKEMDGIAIFQKIHPLAPHIKIIMFSSSKSIPLAVSATKLGVSDFLPKPLAAEQLRQSAEDNLYHPEKIYLTLSGIEAPYLEGQSQKLKDMFAEIEKAIKENQDIILVGALGAEKVKVAELIHRHGFKKDRKLLALDLSSFLRESTEASFWTTVQEIMAEPQISRFQLSHELCGTLYLENLEALGEHFRWSILDFFTAKKGKISREIKVIIGVFEKTILKDFKSKTFRVIEIPALAERKEDLPHLINAYLKRLAQELNKPVKYFSAEALEFLSSYDFPGNYKELEDILRISILSAPEDKIELSHLPLNLEMLLRSSENQIFLKRRFSFGEARAIFEKNLYQILLAKTKDISAAARFLDVPRTTFEERLKTLGLRFPG